MFFPSSTQAKFWIFTPSALAKIKEETNSSVNKLIQERADNADENVKKPESTKIPEKLTVEEEEIIKSYYLLKLIEIYEKKNLPISEKAILTAIVYFKRFYLYQTLMEYNPKILMVTCIYLACKVEESHLRLRDLEMRFSDIRAESIIETELLLLEGLGFHLAVHHPHRALQGFIIDITNKNKKNYEALQTLSKTFLNYSLTTDACFLFPPSQIALAAMLKAAKTFNIEAEVESYIQTIIPDNETFPQFRDKLIKIEPFFVETKLSNVLEKARPINKKLQLWRGINQ